MKYCNKWLLLVSILIVIAIGVIPAITLPVRSRLIDYSIAGENGFAFYALVLGLIVLLQMILTNVQDRIAKVQLIRSSHRMDKERIEHCNRLPYAYTETEEFLQLNAAAKDVAGVFEEMYGAIVGSLQCIVHIVSTMLTLYSVNKTVAIGTMLILGMGVLLNKIQIRNVANLWINYRRNMRKADYLSGILLKPEFVTERKTFGYYDDIEKRFDAEYVEAMAENVHLGKKRLMLESISQAANAGFTIVMLALLAYSLINESISIGVLMSTFYSTTALLASSGRLTSSLYSYASSREKFIPYVTLMRIPEENKTVSLGEVEFETLEFKHVSFQYANAQRPVLQDVSFKLERGKHYALVGENGSGKTTILKCLLGLYTPMKGEILLNGKRIDRYSSYDRCRVLTAVFQDYYRYPLTLRECVTLCTNQVYSDESILEAMKIMDIEKLIDRLPNALDSELQLLKENGSELSGGEWQKLAVLRCVLSDRSFAVLDEPNSALDPIVEASIYEAYRNMLKEKTTLFISHRLGSVKVADKIFVLKDGCIISQGSHAELMESCSYYAKLFETQKGFYTA